VAMGGVAVENGGAGTPVTLYISDTGNSGVPQYIQASPESLTFTYAGLEGSGTLTFPHQLARDWEGNIYLSQTGQYRKYDRNFNFLSNCATAAVPDPQGIEVDQQGGVFVGSASDNGALEKFNCSFPGITPTATSTSTITPTFTITPTPALLSCGSSTAWAVSQPGGLALDGAQKVYVADNSAQQVDVFSPLGVSLANLGQGIMNTPAGVAIDGTGNIYVTDEYQDRVYVFNSLTSPANPGALSTGWGGPGKGTGDLEAPDGIAVNSAGTSIYVADTGNQRIQVFSPSGTFLTQWGGPGIGSNGTFDMPAGVALDASGNVYVADLGTGLVQVFTPSGAFMTEWDATQDTSLLTANFLSVYHNCLIYVTDGFGAVGVFNLNGTALGSLQGPGPGTAFYDTEGIAVGNGGWFVADGGVGQVDGFGNCPVTSCWTPLVTATDTGTPTLTPTNSPTNTITASATTTPTASITSTATPSPTPTITWTPTVTVTFTGTSTPSLTPTPTISSTPTNSPTPVPVTSVCPPYPNPVSGDQISFCYTVAGPSRIRWKVYTTAFRKILDRDEGITPGGTLVWNLKDQWEIPVANGLYYLRVEIEGNQPLSKVLKVIVIR
ncbi:MAG TPA: NHL repeat-containing protein, partial [bacterium]|nr:NHL repeat-containing protein [bacterium]